MNKIQDLLDDTSVQKVGSRSEPVANTSVIQITADKFTLTLMSVNLKIWLNAVTLCSLVTLIIVLLKVTGMLKKPL